MKLCFTVHSCCVIVVSTAITSNIAEIFATPPCLVCVLKKYPNKSCIYILFPKQYDNKSLQDF